MPDTRSKSRSKLAISLMPACCISTAWYASANEMFRSTYRSKILLYRRFAQFFGTLRRSLHLEGARGAGHHAPRARQAHLVALHHEGDRVVGIHPEQAAHLDRDGHLALGRHRRAVLFHR